MNEPLPPLNREFDYHRIPGGDAAYREHYDGIFRKTRYHDLIVGEMIQKGDEYEAQYHPGVWSETAVWGIPYDPARHNRHRRRL